MARSLAALPILLLPILLALIAQGEPAYAPIPWVGFAAAAAFLAWSAIGGARPRWVDLLMTTAMAVAAGHVFFTPGFPRGHDITTHLWGIWAFYQEILAGDLWPRWLHSLGLGMPLLQFYPPVSFYLSLPCLALGLPPHEAIKGAFIIYSILAGASMYWVVARNLQDRRAALVAALAYVWAPYMLMDSHYRNALAEAAAFIMAPLFFEAGMAAVRNPSRKTVAWGALAAGLLIITHPLSASMCCTGIAIWITFEYWPRSVGWGPWFRRLLAFAVVGVAALLVSGFYTIPLAAEAHYTTITGSMGGKRPLFTQHGLKLWQPFEPRRWSGWNMSYATGSDKDEKNQEMPYYVGLGLALLVPLAALPPGRKEEEGGEIVAGEGEAKKAGAAAPAGGALRGIKAPAGLIAMTIGGLLMTTRPLDMVLGWIPNFTMLQFPWRFLFLATVGGAWCAGYAAMNFMAVARSLPGGKTLLRVAPGILGAILIFDAFPYTGAASWSPDYEGVADHIYGGKGCEEDDPRCPGYHIRDLNDLDIPFRAEGTFFFPPADYNIDLSLFKRVYPEYQTEEVRKAFYSKANKDETLDGVLRELGVGWSFSGKGPKPRVIDNIKPYAEWRGPGNETKALPFIRRGGHIIVELPGEAGQVVVKEQYFPGWMRDTVNGRQDVRPDRDGLIQAQVPEGVTSVHFYFSELRGDRFIGWVTSAASLLILFWPGSWGRKEDELEIPPLVAGATRSEGAPGAGGEGDTDPGDAAPASKDPQG